MADIFHNLIVNAKPEPVFRAISTPEGLNKWWTLTCSGAPQEGGEYNLGFGPGYDWRAEVSRCTPDSEFELIFTEADTDWQGSRLKFVLKGQEDKTEVFFKHEGWPEDNEHYRISCFCWAMYLRLMKRFVEFGEVVPYNSRLDV